MLAQGETRSRKSNGESKREKFIEANTFHTWASIKIRESLANDYNLKRFLGGNPSFLTSFIIFLFLILFSTNFCLLYIRYPLSVDWFNTHIWTTKSSQHDHHKTEHQWLNFRPGGWIFGPVAELWWAFDQEFFRCKLSELLIFLGLFLRYVVYKNWFASR